jgi:hypothetical protein
MIAASNAESTAGTDNIAQVNSDGAVVVSGTFASLRLGATADGIAS